MDSKDKEYEKQFFTIAMTIAVSSPTAKALPREVRKEILSKIRTDFAPSITDDDWHQIALDINSVNVEIVSKFKQDAAKAEQGQEITPELEKMEKVMTDHADEIPDESVPKEKKGFLAKLKEARARTKKE